MRARLDGCATFVSVKTLRPIGSGVVGVLTSTLITPDIGAELGLELGLEVGLEVGPDVSGTDVGVKVMNSKSRSRYPALSLGMYGVSVDPELGSVVPVLDSVVPALDPVVPVLGSGSSLDSGPSLGSGSSLGSSYCQSHFERYSHS